MPSPTVVQTSWLRVTGPKDANTCTWCTTWVGRTMPLEMREGFAQYHAKAAGDRPCRCQLEPAEMPPPERDDPSCQWA